MRTRPRLARTERLASVLIGIKAIAQLSVSFDAIRSDRAAVVRHRYGDFSAWIEDDLIRAIAMSTHLIKEGELSALVVDGKRTDRISNDLVARFPVGRV